MNAFWHWPDHIIRRREARALREEHNTLCNVAFELKRALEQQTDACLEAGCTLEDPCVYCRDSREVLEAARKLLKSERQ